MDIDVRIAITILSLIIGGVVVYYTALHKLKDYFRDKLEEQNKFINELKIEIEKLKSKDEIQQITIDQLSKYFLSNLADFIEILKNKDKLK